ncbi:phage protease [Magnetospirillum sp. 15-1]|uniref:phage protease n=1 Tax=Magnetospirillum sp. 15-1 TaxID=1979370 RepID=UPI000BBBCC91|nr:phage protease [Magnetospirillum sp. 15-1]
MTTELIATCSMTLAAGAPDRVHLLPFGTVQGRDGRGPYTVRDKAHAAQVIAATKAHQRGADLPVDYEHQNQLAPPHVKPRPAAGWVKWDSLEIGPNGIWGRVEWTATAAQHLGERAYRYLSPVFNHTQDGTVLRIVGAALTNFPNLAEITALASQGATMPGYTLTSAKALMGMAAADDATFLKCCGDLAKLTKAFVTQLGLPAETDAAGLLDALMQKAKNPPAVATASQTPEMAATLEALQAVASQAETYRQQLSQAQVDKAVSDAMGAGQISPAMRDWATALASQAPDSFDTFVKTMPPIFANLFKSDFEGRPAMPPTDDASCGLSAGQLAVCSQMGVSPEDYRKNLKG